MSIRFIQRNGNIKDTLMKAYLLDLDAEGESRYRLLVNKMNRLWEGYRRVENANNELVADKLRISELFNGIDIKKAKKDELITLLIEIEKIVNS